MIRYQTQALSVEQRIQQYKKRIDEMPLKVAKVELSRAIAELEKQVPHQKLNVHSRESDSQCSCWLSLQLETPARVEQDIVFRTHGHIDHEKGKLTKVFVRRWPQSGLNPEFFAAWCVDCGFLYKADPFTANHFRININHVCPKDALVQSVIKELKRSIIKPGTKPVVAGATSWNAAINKAILVIQEKAD